MLEITETQETQVVKLIENCWQSIAADYMMAYGHIGQVSVEESREAVADRITFNLGFPYHPPTEWKTEKEFQRWWWALRGDQRDMLIAKAITKPTCY